MIFGTEYTHQLQRLKAIVLFGNPQDANSEACSLPETSPLKGVDNAVAMTRTTPNITMSAAHVHTTSKSTCTSLLSYLHEQKKKLNHPSTLFPQTKLYLTEAARFLR